MTDETRDDRQTKPKSGWKSLEGDEFSVADAIGGVRGFLESALPGIVFVTAFIIWGGYQIPVIAATAAVVVTVAARLIQRTPVTQALGGVFGVALGAVWAWRAGEPSEYFLPGLLTNAATLVVLGASMLRRWPVVGIVLSFLKGATSPKQMLWRADAAVVRTMQLATGILAGLFALKLAIQVPLYLADQVAVLGTVKLVMGLPLFTLTLWFIWRLVRGVELELALPDRPQPKE